MCSVRQGLSDAQQMRLGILCCVMSKRSRILRVVVSLGKTRKITRNMKDTTLIKSFSFLWRKHLIVRWTRQKSWRIRHCHHNGQISSSCRVWESLFLGLLENKINFWTYTHRNLGNINCLDFFFFFLTQVAENNHMGLNFLLNAMSLFLLIVFRRMLM